MSRPKQAKKKWLGQDILEQQRAFFIEHGYLLLRNALDPDTDLGPLRLALSNYVDELLDHVLGPGLASLSSDLKQLEFESRFASLEALSRGAVYHHLDPVLNVYERDFRPWKGAPSAQLPEMFELMRHPLILDAIENLIGGEIRATAVYHLTTKLSPGLKTTAKQVASDAQKAGFRPAWSISPSPFADALQSGQTPWHIDSYRGLGNDSCPFYVNAWIPLTSAVSRNAALAILPGSHRPAFTEFPSHREHEALVLDTQPGDVVLLDGCLFHSSMPPGEGNSYRCAFNMRYLPISARNGRPFLPDFIARSRLDPDSELQDPLQWQKNWKSALDYFARYLPPQPNPFRLSTEQVARRERRWQKLIPDRHNWDDLHRHGTLFQALQSRLLWALDHQRVRISRKHQ